jgi:hypothetical protein
MPVSVISTISFLYVVKKSRKFRDAGVTWQDHGKKMSHGDFLPHAVTMNAQYYSKLIHNDVHEAIQEKRPRKL